MKLPTELFFTHFVFYLPYTKVRLVVKLDPKLDSILKRNAFNRLVKLPMLIENLLNNKLILPNIFKKYIIIKCIKSVNHSLLFKFFGITLTDLCDLIKKDMSLKYSNGIHLSDSQIIRELDVFLDIGNVLEKINYNLS